jgi:hypothetical protein
MESTVLGNALLIKVEKESTRMRLVFGDGKSVVGCASSAIRWARVGVEKWVRLSSRSGKVRGGGGLDDVALVWGIIGWNEVKIWEQRAPDRGCDASRYLSVRDIEGEDCRVSEVAFRDSTKRGIPQETRTS